MSPFIPVVDVQIRTADGGHLDLDQDFVGPRARQRYRFHPDTGFGPMLDQGFHLVSHVRTPQFRNRHYIGRGTAPL